MRLSSLCVVDGKWGRWGPFGECILSGTNKCTRQREKLCNNPAPANGGAKCDHGKLLIKYQRKSCNSKKCGEFLYPIQATSTWLSFIFYENKYAFSCHISILGCAKNQYPIGISRGCQREFSCDKLASSDKCDNKYIQAMSRGCNIPLKKYWQNQVVKRHCKRACKNCEGIFQFSIYFLCL